MVRIFKDGKPNGNGAYMVQTTCLTPDDFISELAEAIASLPTDEPADDRALNLMGVLSTAMPIAFKLSGYKAETVNEQRTLVNGTISPADSEIIATAGR